MAIHLHPICPPFSATMRNAIRKHFCLQNPSISALLFLSLCFHHTLLISGNSPSSLIDNIALDCGSTTDTTDGRNWTADTNSKFFLLDPTNASKHSSALHSPMIIDPVPYNTARLSRSQFTYVFPVTSGPKFIRLYFFPSSYPDFTSSVRFFSVKANRYTLLTNFTSVPTSQAPGSDGFSREFCLNVEDGQMLNITFVPTPGVTDAYAYINGIEIVSMPANLYYTGKGDPGFKFMGSNNLSSLKSSTALELMYRINVGGAFISPSNDSGMFRSWSRDDDYLTIQNPSAYPYNGTIQLQYSDNRTRDAAPDLLYQTARSMGNDKTTNEHYNLTWDFQVDSKFTYLVRLHFCEFRPQITQEGEIVFLIYIATQIAESKADVIKWSGGNSFPVFKDYGVTIEPEGNQRVQNISIALHPRIDLTSYSDAFLNGLEIFKLSNSDNLAAPNPEIPLIRPPNAATPSPKSTKPNNNRTTVAAIIGGAVSGFLALSFLFFLIFRRRLKVKDKGSSDAASWWGPFSVSSTKSVKTQGSALPSDLCRRFSLAEIKDATNSFDSVLIIGVGGFGNVYKGFINDGATTVAIKRLNPESRQGANEFKTEIEMLSQLRFLHLVSLIGYCYEDGEMILVYDYMAQGTLRDHLYKTHNPPISWNQRLEICIGAARGLQYLHSGAKNTIIHRDVKTTNILLDEKWVAKVSDFGLSKIGSTSIAKPHISTVVKGSFGYLDPEYFRFQRLTEKSDVYSFGVVLCEVLSARPPVNRSAVETPASLAEWARQCYRNGTLDEIIDPYLQGKIAPDCLRKFAEVAVSCLHDNGVERPSMGDVVWGLEFALQLQETAIKHCKLPTEIDSDMESALKGSSVADSSDDIFSSSSSLMIGSRLRGMTFTTSSGEQSFLNNSSEKVKSGAIFSEISNPAGR